MNVEDVMLKAIEGGTSRWCEAQRRGLSSGTPLEICLRERRCHFRRAEFLTVPGEGGEVEGRGIYDSVGRILFGGYRTSVARRLAGSLALLRRQSRGRGDCRGVFRGIELDRSATHLSAPPPAPQGFYDRNHADQKDNAGLGEGRPCEVVPKFQSEGPHR